ncbi:ACT domain-containing protein [Anaerovibrio sp. JC8]|uniref:ACT domain-containing protein n=1 Tax=Anaerovibrio sp. JC8 TaxID=1240085 RepID=UPI000A106DC8|nr:ACT domain-containing protein [Anaerovibrio sp. JC8]
MELIAIQEPLTVCKVPDMSEVDLTKEFFFLSKTKDEISLVCRTEDAPQKCSAREDNWRGFYINGILEFSMVGILAKLSNLLADNGISIYAVSTYNTDYILMKAEQWDNTRSVLLKSGYSFK